MRTVRTNACVQKLHALMSSPRTSRRSSKKKVGKPTYRRMSQTSERPNLRKTRSQRTLTNGSNVKRTLKPDGLNRVKAKDVARAAARDRQRLLTNKGVDRLSPLAGTVVQESVGDGKKATQVAKKKRKGR